MGDLATSEDRTHQLEILCCDYGGLSEIRVVADGSEIHYRHLRGDTRWQEMFTMDDGISKYVRVEARSRDGRRAYSNPIYFS